MACNLSNNFKTDTFGVIHIEAKSLGKLNSNLIQDGSVLVDTDGKLKVNVNDSFFIDSNGKINFEIANGLAFLWKFQQ